MNFIFRGTQPTMLSTSCLDRLHQHQAEPFHRQSLGSLHGTLPHSLLHRPKHVLHVHVLCAACCAESLIVFLEPGGCVPELGRELHDRHRGGTAWLLHWFGNTCGVLSTYEG